MKQSSIKVEKSLLSQLRKETGFGFAKCKESLQLNNNDFEAALTWLEAEAEKQGWEKATKLQGRVVSEGLVGVLVDGNHAAMVEVCSIIYSSRHLHSEEIVWVFCLRRGTWRVNCNLLVSNHDIIMII